MKDIAPKTKVICSFCGLGLSEVDHMLTMGPGKPYICDQCIELAAEIIAEERRAREMARDTVVRATANFPTGSLGEEVEE